MTKAYSGAGSYTVQVTATNSAGSASSSTLVRVVSMQGTWIGTVTGHTRFPPQRPIAITSFELRINQTLPARPSTSAVSANWLDSAGCRQNFNIIGDVVAPNTAFVSIESLLCNDGDFSMTGTPDADGRVITGTCTLGGPNCKFTMTRQ